MKKNDKIIVAAGVVILILAAVGIYYWEYEEATETADVEDFFTVYGEMKDLPDAIEISDSCPFYALVATPVAVNYDMEGEQNVIPLYVKNFEETSSAIVRSEELIGITPNEIIEDGTDIKEVSLEFAEKYWESSKGALIIEYTQSGYNLGVLATPLASYFCIPVIVTDEIDADVRTVLSDLGVERTIVCGDLDGYGDVLKFETVYDVVNASIEVVREKFGEVEYITITNPIDIHEPEVLDNKTYGPFIGSIMGASILPSQVGTVIRNIGTALSGTNLGEFTIPEDYKYALIKFEGTAEYQEPENPDEYGSHAAFDVTGDYELFGTGLNTAGGGIPIRDANGDMILDRVYSENVAYDLGGETFSVSGRGMLFVSDSAEATVNIVIQKLSDPLYPMMKKLSSIAPYLTAYRCGIIFGMPEFAFVADDHIRTVRDETSPGVIAVRNNHGLQYASNNHVFWIHDEINDLLAKLADIELGPLDSLRNLRNYYKENPVYISLVGGNVVLPQLILDSYLTPADPDNFISAKYGLGIPTDVIYGNIDPIPNEWPMTAKDVYYEENENFPYQENIVGRITGWDIQDVSAVVARTIFYENIINKLGDWKNKATVQTGCGTDFLRPPIANFLSSRIAGNNEPIKWPSGSTEFFGEALAKNSLEPLGFEVFNTKYTESQIKGFTDKAINEIKKANLFSRIFFGPRLVKFITGENKVNGGQYMEDCNFIWQNAHGMPNGYEFGDAMTNALGWRPILNGIINYLARTRIIPILNTGMTSLGAHNTRNIDALELGPSVMIIESCFCGKIDGMYPENAISQTPIHAGVNSLIAATTESNVPGGYLEPYYNFDRYNIIGNILTRINVRRDIYPEASFGHIIYKDLYESLGKDKDVGTALRDARNDYYPQDWESTFKWVPPLKYGGYNPLSGNVNLEPNVPEHKALSYYAYTLYGDPAFNPYVPGEY